MGHKVETTKAKAAIYRSQKRRPRKREPRKRSRNRSVAELAVMVRQLAAIGERLKALARVLTAER